jgi:hypothetical protein
LFLFRVKNSLDVVTNLNVLFVVGIIGFGSIHDSGGFGFFVLLLLLLLLVVIVGGAVKSLGQDTEFFTSASVVFEDGIKVHFEIDIAIGLDTIAISGFLDALGQSVGVAIDDDELAAGVLGKAGFFLNKGASLRESVPVPDDLLVKDALFLSPADKLVGSICWVVIKLHGKVDNVLAVFVDFLGFLVAVGTDAIGEFRKLCILKALVGSDGGGSVQKSKPTGKGGVTGFPVLASLKAVATGVKDVKGTGGLVGDASRLADDLGVTSFLDGSNGNAPDKVSVAVFGVTL